MKKYSRKTFTAKRLRSLEFGFALFEAFDTPVSAASQNTNQFSKSPQSKVEFSAVQSITVDMSSLRRLKEVEEFQRPFKRTRSVSLKGEKTAVPAVLSNNKLTKWKDKKTKVLTLKKDFSVPCGFRINPPGLCSNFIQDSYKT